MAENQLTPAQQLIKEERARLAALEAEEAARRAEEEKQRKFKETSKHLTMLTLDGYINALASKAALTAETHEKYIKKVMEVYGREKAEEAYIRTAIKLITDATRGVEFGSHKIDNGALVFQAQAWENVDSLHQHLKAQLGSVFEQFETSAWLHWLLKKEYDDPTYLASRLVKGFESDFKGIMNQIKRVIEAEKLQVVVPDLNTLTIDDSLFLADFFGEIM